MKILTSAAACLSLAVTCQAYPAYQSYFPNGAAYTNAFGGGKGNSLGHRTGNNVFRNDFRSRRAITEDAAVWSRNDHALCESDPDGDGFTNGEELGDPNCTWLNGQTPPTELTSDPMDASSTPLTGLNPAGPAFYLLGHAGLMILAWALLVPYAISQAVLYKKTGEPEWFTAHQYANSAAVFFTIIAFILMLALGPGIEGLTGTLHAIIGLVVIALSLVQVLSGMLRPHVEEVKDSSRLWWEFGHQWTGRITYLLALFAIASGMPLGFGDDIATAIGYVIAGIGAVGFVGGVYSIYMRDNGFVGPFSSASEKGVGYSGSPPGEQLEHRGEKLKY